MILPIHMLVEYVWCWQLALVRDVCVCSPAREEMHALISRRAMERYQSAQLNAKMLVFGILTFHLVAAASQSGGRIFVCDAV